MGRYERASLFGEKAVVQGLAYMRDNPRLFFEKHVHPELFRVLRDLAWSSSMLLATGALK